MVPEAIRCICQVRPSRCHGQERAVNSSWRRGWFLSNWWTYSPIMRGYWSSVFNAKLLYFTKSNSANNDVDLAVSDY